MKNVWSKSGNMYALSEISHQEPSLPAGVYRLEFNQLLGSFYLEHVQDRFDFPYKIYGVETSFIQRVKRSWENTQTNMGVLLNGLKGTGKTVTAELICNKLELPVILIQKPYEGLVSFLNSIQQDVIVFIDEYDKIFDRYNNSLLSIMDGVFRTDSRKMFLLTTNELSIEKNMLQRPSRIRYIKSYTDLTLDVIIEIVNDKLIHKHLRDCTIKMISELPIITMDLVKAVVEEVNIHEEDPAMFKDIFNVQGDQSDIYDVYMVDDSGVKNLFAKSAHVYPNYFSTYEEGSEIYINKRRVGRIEKYINKSQLLIELLEEDLLEEAEDPNADLYRSIESLEPKVARSNKQTTQARFHLFYFEPAVKQHAAFNVFAF